MKNLIFYLGMGTLFTHELDAMLNHEWRVLPLIRVLPDDLASVVFTLAHIPLFALLIAGVASTKVGTRRLTQYAIAGFLVVHAGLHALFVNHPQYEFTSLVSNGLVYGGAFCGLVFLVIEFLDRSRNAA